MRILIVEDSEVIRSRLVALLQSLAGVEIVGQAETVAQAMTALYQLKPDAITLDLELPDGNGLVVLNQIAHEHLPIAVLVLTNHPHAQYEKWARAAGAYAFLNKGKDFALIPDLLQSLISAAPPVEPG